MSPESVADALARVCADQAEIREQLEETGEVAVLNQLVAAVQSAADPRAQLEELHLALQRAGDALGLYGPQRGTGLPGVRAAGLGAARPVEVAFFCPRGDCTRTWRPEPDSGTSAARCSLYGEPLAWKQV
jgi:hypothetical protein